MERDPGDDVYYSICWRQKLEGETENMGVCTKERKGVAARPFYSLFAVDDDVYYSICWRLKLEGETENMGVCTKERKGVQYAL